MLGSQVSGFASASLSACQGMRRLAWVTAFCIGPFGGNERTWKPFNPILGETFELDVGNNVRFLAEQACGAQLRPFAGNAGAAMHRTPIVEFIVKRKSSSIQVC